MDNRYFYDGNGNRTHKNQLGGDTLYHYDAFNRTTKVETFDGNMQINRYDAEGLRYEMEENGRLVRFIFHKGEDVAEQEENSNVIRLIRSTELIARSTDAVRTYYHYASDEMGSTTHIVDDEGQVQNRYEYDAWGNLTLCEENISNRFKFTGQQLDPITQQHYLRARFYNPVIARFTQEDTYLGDGLNLYAYCANNPVFYVDPSGHTATCLKEAYLKEVECLKNEYVNDNMSAEEKAAAIERARKDAYQAAKQVYQANHAVNHPEPNLPQVTDGSMTRAEWEKAYQDHRLQQSAAEMYARAVELQSVRNNWQRENGTTAVIRAIDNGLGGEVILIATNQKDKNIISDFSGVLRENERYIGGPEHAEQTIFTSDPSRYTFLAGGASRNVCSYLCAPLVEKTGMQLGGPQFRGMSDKTKYRMFWRK